MLEVVLYVMSIGWFASVVALAAKSIIYALAADEPPPLMVTAVLFCSWSQICESSKDEKTDYNKMDVAIGNTAPFQADWCRDASKVPDGESGQPVISDKKSRAINDQLNKQKSGEALRGTKTRVGSFVQ